MRKGGNWEREGGRERELKLFSMAHTHACILTRFGSDLGRLKETNSEQPIAEREQIIVAFKSGNEQVAEQLLPNIRPAVVRTTFQSRMYLRT